ncbi:MAG: YgfZ/GcvT domain-containing protein [Nitrospirota bacterium]
MPTTTDLDHDYRVLRSSAGAVDRANRARLRVTGSTRGKFLQGILTNDVNALSPGHGLYAAVLTGKGKMQTDLTVYALSDWWWVDAEPEIADKLPALLARYTIGTDAAVSNLAATHSLFSLHGPTAPRVLATAFPGRSLPSDHLAVTESEWNGNRLIIAEAGYPGTPGFKILAQTEAIEAARGAVLAAGATPVDPAALEIVRIESGVPRFGIDMSEENFPPESRIEERAISYTKGCYMGQETIARIKTYGHVNRLLVGLHAESDQPVRAGTRIIDAGDEHKDVGYVTSSVRSPALGRVIALGYVHRSLEAPGTRVALGAESRIRATVVPLPFVPTT